MLKCWYSAPSNHPCSFQKDESEHRWKKTMAEQIIINIVRPDVGIEYRPESHEAELADRLAACELTLHALAQHVRKLRGCWVYRVPMSWRTWLGRIPGDMGYRPDRVASQEAQVMARYISEAIPAEGLWSCWR